MNLAFSSSFAGFRLFTSVVVLSQRNDTRNDTRREKSPGLFSQRISGARSKTVVPPNVSPNLLSSKIYAGRLTVLPSILGPASEE